jgi:hypothetical protein
MPRKGNLKSKYTPKELLKETQRLIELVSTGEYPSFFKAVHSRDPKFSVSTLYRTYKKIQADPSRVNC